MNKKLAMVGIGAVVGTMLLASSVYAGVGDAPGYEALKTAVRKTAAVDNVTRQVNVSVQDNGQSLLDVRSTIKTDRASEAGSATVAVASGGVQMMVAFYNQDGKHIIKTDGSDVYKLLPGQEEHASAHRPHWDGPADPEAGREAEQVFDALVGNLKNYVVLDEGPGSTKDIRVQLSGSQIPTVVNTIGSLLIKHGAAAQGEHQLTPADTLGFDTASLREAMPHLTQDVKIDEVKLNATVDADDHITNQTAQIEISGKDADGRGHAVVVSMDMSLSSLNATVPDKVDLSGKQVEELKLPEGRGWNHHE